MTERGGLAGFLGGLFGGGGTPLTMYAKGGRIGPGETGIVGEAGAELVTGPATVIPFDKVAGGSRVIRVVYKIDARGADQAAIARLENSMNKMTKNFEKYVIAAVTNRRLRAPGFVG